MYAGSMKLFSRCSVARVFHRERERKVLFNDFLGQRSKLDKLYREGGHAKPSQKILA